MEQDLDKIDATSPSSSNIPDEDYDDVPIKKLKTERHNSKTPIILIDDSEDSSSSLTKSQNNYQNEQNGLINNHQSLPKTLPPNFSPNNFQSPPFFPQYFSPEYPKNNLLDAFPYRPNPPVYQSPPNAYHPNSFPQFNNRPPMPHSQENRSYQPFRPGPPNSFTPQFRPQEPQIPLRNQGVMHVNNSFETKGIPMETEQQNKMPKSQPNIEENGQKMPLNELVKKAAIAKKSTKGRPNEREGTPGKVSAYIQPTQTERIPEKTSPNPMIQSTKDAIKSVDKSPKVDPPGKPQDQKPGPQIPDTKVVQNNRHSPITKPGSASKTAKKPGLGASVPVFSKQKSEEVKTDEKKPEEKVIIKKQRREKNISLFQPSNQELHELIAKELNEGDEEEIENELTLNELIIKYSRRHQNKRHASLRLHEYFELIEGPRHKPEEYPANYKLFL